ncbi:hypothetical protein SASPL_109226 [Salvia splendens]|uniref:NAD(P)-binding domain-containing protein n=1 Tax=Salvia splendens TaxID=180675 RepID=A0A8X8YEI2_SALSN|nr:hypothetical protein SASPL_109226 [Salvia splendens]
MFICTPFNCNGFNLNYLKSNSFKNLLTQLVRRGFNVIAVARERSGIKGKNSKDETLGLLSGANACFSDDCRSGGVKDSWLNAYEATKNSLVVGRKFGAAHFVLLSAIYVQKPLLEFQRAKLKFEAELIKETGGYACASLLVLPIGGPRKAVTLLEQGEMLFRLAGKGPKFLKVPIQIMDFAIGILDFLVKIFPSLEDTAEFGKIGRYYAAESMLIWDPETGKYDADSTPSYGNDTLEGFFKRVLEQGMAGQELGEQTIF